MTDVLRSTGWAFCRRVWFSLTSCKNFSLPSFVCVSVVWNWYVQLCFLLSFFFSWLVFSEISGLVSAINFGKFLATIIISNIPLLCFSFLSANIPIMYTLHLLLLIKVCLVKAMVFPVVRYGHEICTIKKAERQRIDAFELWHWRRILRVPWTGRRSNQSILKEIGPEYSLEGLMLKLKLQYFGHLMQRMDWLEKTLMLGKIEAGGEGDDRGWEGWMASLTQWTWVWASSGCWWRTGKPGVLQSMGSQKVRQEWATELNYIFYYCPIVLGCSIFASILSLCISVLEVSQPLVGLCLWTVTFTNVSPME